jgi:hypothetical protein
MIYKKIVAALFLVMFGAETMNSVPNDVHLEQSETDDEILDQLRYEETVGQSRIINCQSWDEIKEKVSEHINCHEDKRILVGLDVDGTQINSSSVIIDDKMIPEFFTMLSEKSAMSFCLTAANSCLWPKRREEFDKTGLYSLLHNSDSEPNIPFLRNWEKNLDDRKRYYWDCEYSTMYSTRMRASSRFSEENPCSPEPGTNSYEILRKIGGRLETSKGIVFRSAVEDGIIATPDVMVFIDDSFDSVQDVCLVCYQLGINCLGIFCTLY